MFSKALREFEDFIEQRLLLNDTMYNLLAYSDTNPYVLLHGHHTGWVIYLHIFRCRQRLVFKRLAWQVFLFSYQSAKISIYIYIYIYTHTHTHTNVHTNLIYKRIIRRPLSSKCILFTTQSQII